MVVRGEVVPVEAEGADPYLFLEKLKKIIRSTSIQVPSKTNRLTKDLGVFDKIFSKKYFSGDFSSFSAKNIHFSK